MVCSMGRETTSRAPPRPGSLWDLRRPLPRPFITETTFCFYSQSRAGSRRDGPGRLLLLGPQWKYPLPSLSSGNNFHARNSYLIFFISFFPFPKDVWRYPYFKSRHAINLSNKACECYLVQFSCSPNYHNIIHVHNNIQWDIIMHNVLCIRPN